MRSIELEITTQKDKAMLYKNVLIFLFFIFGTSLAIADESQRYQKIDGMSVYLGVIPAQITKKYRSMHGGGTNNEHSYHVVIALFDEKLGERIIDAKVIASVTALAMKGVTKVLEPMHGDLLSYGNYFTMHTETYYDIKVEIQRAEKTAKTVAKFTFKRSRD